MDSLARLRVFNPMNKTYIPPSKVWLLKTGEPSFNSWDNPDDQYYDTFLRTPNLDKRIKLARSRYHQQKALSWDKVKHGF